MLYNYIFQPKNMPSKLNLTTTNLPHSLKLNPAQTHPNCQDSYSSPAPEVRWWSNETDSWLCRQPSACLALLDKSLCKAAQHKSSTICIERPTGCMMGCRAGLLKIAGMGTDHHLPVQSAVEVCTK